MVTRHGITNVWSRQLRVVLGYGDFGQELISLVGARSYPDVTFQGIS